MSLLASRRRGMKYTYKLFYSTAISALRFLKVNDGDVILKTTFISIDENRKSTLHLYKRNEILNIYFVSYRILRFLLSLMIYDPKIKKNKVLQSTLPVGRSIGASVAPSVQSK